MTNYIHEINQFDSWRETHQLSSSEILLWFVLMQLNNKCGWKNEFSVALSVLETKTGLSRSSIVRARKGLQQAKRISFKSRTGQQSAIYSIIAFHTEPQNGTQNEIAFHTEPESEPQSGTQSGSINKLNKKQAAGEIDIEKVKGYLRIATDQRISDEQITQEAEELKKKYRGKKIENLRSLCNNWADGIMPWQMKKMVI